MPRARVEPPSWWRSELYSFIDDMQLEGWVWEFMRRSELKKILEGKPIDAMNPRPKLRHLNETDADYYYMPWPVAIRRYGGQLEQPFCRLRAVRFRVDWHGRGIQIPTPRGKWITDIAIDLNRRDRIIRRDFAALLNQTRIQEDIPQPKGIKPHVGNWKNPLMVWDLYQYNLPLKTIADLLHIDPPAQADPEWRTLQINNYHDEAVRYIDEGGWEEFARFI